MPDRRKMVVYALLAIVGLIILVPAAAGEGEGRTVVLIEVSGTIDPGLASYIGYALDEAVSLDAAAVIIEFDTPGGYINSAEKIRRRMDEYNRPIYAFVRPNAISAGAYLALAADAIYMVPGSTMGAAEPSILGIGEVDEKSLSFWEKEMVGMAERNDRDPLIASAMVRRDVAIEGLVESGSLLTLTAREALENGYAEGIIEDRSALLAEVGFSGASIIQLDKRLTDRLVGWTTNPIFGTLLLMIGIAGLVVEVMSAGFGIAGLVGLTAFMLYFGGNIAAGMADYWVLILFGFGVILMLVEAFMPGLGIFGITGLVSTVVAVVLAAASIQTGLVMVLVSFVLAGLFSALSFRYFASRGALRHIILSEEERAELGYVAPLDQKHLAGKTGVAITVLRPSGTAQIEGRRIDVVSEGGFIPAGEKIIVDRVEGVRVIVRHDDN